MASAKKSLQVSMRMLLRGPSDRGGVLLRQRCTSRLRRWTSRPHHPAAGSQPDVDRDELARSCPSRGEELAYATDCHVSEDFRRTSEGAAPLMQEAKDLRTTWRNGSGVRGTIGPFGSLGHPATESSSPEAFMQMGNQRMSLHSPSVADSRTGRATSHLQVGLELWRREFSSTEGDKEGSDEGDKKSIHVTFVNRDGSEKTIEVPVGMHMLQAAHDNDIDLEGACEASLACSTCHVIFEDEKMYNHLPEPSEEENDMLDLAFGLTPTSRLGCQVVATKELDGLRLRIPSATRNFAVDGFVPKPH